MSSELLQPKISIIVPTCRRPDDLREMLESVAGQSLQGKNWETIVVDNAPCTETREVVESFAGRISALSCIAEPEPGLLAARHAGLRQARADLLLYADDDIIASPDWVANVLQGFYLHGASIVGGSNLPLYAGQPPLWMDSLWERQENADMMFQYSVMRMRKDEPVAGTAWGCNFGISKAALLRAGGFHPDGCPWNMLASRGAGETHVVEAVRRQGGKTLLMPGASVQHKISASRMTPCYLWKRGAAEGATISAELLRSRGITSGHFPGGKGAHAIFASGFLAGFLFQRFRCLEDAALAEWLLRDSYLGKEHIPGQPAELPVPPDSALEALLMDEHGFTPPATMEGALAQALTLLPGRRKQACLLAGYLLLLCGRAAEGGRMLEMAALDPTSREAAMFLAMSFNRTAEFSGSFGGEAWRHLAAHEKNFIGTIQPISAFGALVRGHIPAEAVAFTEVCLKEIASCMTAAPLDDNSLEYYAYGAEDARQADRKYLQEEVVMSPAKRFASWAGPLTKEVLTKHYLYQRLADAQSRDLLTRLALYRTLGHRHVRLPYCTATGRALRDELWRRTACAGTDAALDELLQDISGDASGRYSFFDLTRLGRPLRLYSSDEEIYRHFFAPNYVYESTATRIRPENGDILMDCGACLADTGLFFAEAVGPQGKVICFEPMPKNQRIVQANLALNPHLAARITLVPATVGGRHGDELEFSEWGPSPHAGDAGKAGLNKVHVPVVSLDGIAQEMDLPRVDFIKMDIEGAELDALHGAEGLLLRFRPRLAICLYHRPEDFTTIPLYLDSLQLGYRFYLEHHYVNQFETVLYAESVPQEEEKA